MRSKTRRYYAPEFKQEAVELASQPGATVARVARDWVFTRNLSTKSWENQFRVFGDKSARYLAPPWTRTNDPLINRMRMMLLQPIELRGVSLFLAPYELPRHG